MSNQKINFFYKILFLSFLFIILSLSKTYADKINKFEISGNDRISNETIILFSGYKINDDINSNDLNNVIKKLYETNFFENISINFKNNILV